MPDCGTVRMIPGPAGAAGAAGDDGTDGINAFTTTTAAFTMPAVNSSVVVSVVEAGWASINGSSINGQVVHVQNSGYFFVSNSVSSTSLELNNLGYPGNAAVGAVIPSGSKVSPAGLRGTGGPPNYALAAEEEASGVDAGGFTSGAWRTRDINTELADTASLIVVAGSQITLQAGNWQVQAGAVAYRVDDHQVRWYNSTDGIAYYGTCSRAGATDEGQTVSVVHARFNLPSPKIFELQHRCTTTRAADGMGKANAFGTTQRYAWVELRAEG